MHFKRWKLQETLCQKPTPWSHAETLTDGFWTSFPRLKEIMALWDTASKCIGQRKVATEHVFSSWGLNPKNQPAACLRNSTCQLEFWSMTWKCIQNTANDSDYGFILYVFYLPVCLFGWYFFFQSTMNCRTCPPPWAGDTPAKWSPTALLAATSSCKKWCGSTHFLEKEMTSTSKCAMNIFWETYLIIPYCASIFFLM